MGVGTRWMLDACVCCERMAWEGETKWGGGGGGEEEVRRDIAHLFPPGICVEINVPANALICQRKYKNR